MSYDIDFEIDAEGSQPTIVGDSLNYTSNCSLMFRRALEGGIPALDGRIAGDAVPELKGAVDHMRNNPDIYEPMNPPNRWGRYSQATEWLAEILANAERHPQATIRVSC